MIRSRLESLERGNNLGEHLLPLVHRFDEMSLQRAILTSEQLCDSADLCYLAG